MNTGEKNTLSTQTSQEPKIFGWLWMVAQELQTDARRNDHGELLTHECHVLCAGFLEHLVSRLQSFHYGYGIAERYLTELHVQELERAAVRAYAGADLAKLADARARAGAQMLDVCKVLSSSIISESRWIFPQFPGKSTFQDVFVRAPAAAGYFWTRLVSKWQSIAPAKKFFLLGGHDALAQIHGGRVPHKLVYYAILHICIRGTATSHAVNVFSGIGCELPNEHQTKDARRFIRAIPSIHSLRMRSAAQNERLSPFVSGLQTRISHRGRSSGSRAGARARAKASS